MINANESQIILEEWFADNVHFWMNNKSGDTCTGDERESFKRALEWDLIQIYKHDNNTLHDCNVPNGDILDHDTCINFFKYRCMDLYGKDWEKHWKEYKICD